MIKAMLAAAGIIIALVVVILMFIGTIINLFYIGTNYGYGAVISIILIGVFVSLTFFIYGQNPRNNHD